MIKGVLNTDSKSGIYITDAERAENVNVRSGQCLYLAVHDCWVPVIIRFSPRSHGWFFQDLEDVDVDGQKVMIKS